MPAEKEDLALEIRKQFAVKVMFLGGVVLVLCSASYFLGFPRSGRDDNTWFWVMSGLGVFLIAIGAALRRGSRAVMIVTLLCLVPIMLAMVAAALSGKDVAHNLWHAFQLSIPCVALVVLLVRKESHK